MSHSPNFGALAGHRALAHGWRTRLWLWSERFLDLFFPPRCVGCHSPGTHLCAKCQTAIERLAPPLCRRCGRPLDGPRASCLWCAQRPLQIDAIRGVGYHRGVLRQAVLALKYAKKPGVALPLGELLADWISENGWRTDALVAVPLHPERERERGYNQAALLTQVAAARLEMEYLEHALVRVRATADQIGLGWRERQHNMAGAFVARREEVDRRAILLIDDVTTTGATLDACAQALYQAGASRVRGLAVAQAF